VVCDICSVLLYLCCVVNFCSAFLYLEQTCVVKLMKIVFVLFLFAGVIYLHTLFVLFLHVFVSVALQHIELSRPPYNTVRNTNAIACHSVGILQQFPH